MPLSDTWVLQVSATDPSQSYRFGINGHEIALPLESLEYIGLLSQHKPITLLSNISKTPPPLKSLRIPLIPMRRLRILPMTLRKPQQSRHLLLLDVIDQGANSTSLLEPIALPQFAGSDALIRAGLVVYAAGHGTAVDGVYDAVLGEEPHFVSPLFGLARLGVLGVVVVDEVGVSYVLFERRVERCVCQERRFERHCRDYAVRDKLD